MADVSRSPSSLSSQPGVPLAVGRWTTVGHTSEFIERDVVRGTFSTQPGVPVAPVWRWTNGCSTSQRTDRQVWLSMANGGMGARFETGVITVTAHPDRVDVTADRLINYSGVFTPNAPHAPFDIAAPTVDVSQTGRTLSIPVTPAVRMVAIGRRGDEVKLGSFITVTP